jgi:hypothetical protein
VVRIFVEAPLNLAPLERKLPQNRVTAMAASFQFSGFRPCFSGVVFEMNLNLQLISSMPDNNHKSTRQKVGCLNELQARRFAHALSQ